MRMSVASVTWPDVLRNRGKRKTRTRWARAAAPGKVYGARLEPDYTPDDRAVLRHVEEKSVILEVDSQSAVADEG